MRARSVGELRRSFSKSWGVVIESSFFLISRSKDDADAPCCVGACGFNNYPIRDERVEQSRPNITGFMFPDTRELLNFTPRWNGHHVDTATNGREAFALLAEHSYDVILSNLNMPGIDGEDLYRRIEHGWPHLAPRVVFVTAAKLDNSFQAQYGGRPVPVLIKPYTPQRLLQVIDDVVARDV